MVGRKLGYTILGIVVPMVLFVLAYIGYVWNGVPAGVARSAGTISGLGLHAPVQIVRDARGVPHIRAASLSDAAFAQGYAIAGDRLFQIDVTRRLVLGQLSGMFGSTALNADREARIVDVRHIIDSEYAHLPAGERSALQAFADGVNAAAEREPLPPEYRALLFRFAPWQPQDALAVGYAVVLDLTDSWYDVIARDAVERELGAPADAAFFSLTDPRYDAPTLGGLPVPIPPLPALPGAHPPPALAWIPAGEREGLGSNAWIAGAERTATHRALLANDPHLARHIPGVWYLVDLAYPGVHVAGATLAGVPGVILGHNDRLAWGATNSEDVSPRVFSERFDRADGTRYLVDGRWVEARVRHERIVDRFGGTSTRDYLTTRHGFVIEQSGTVRHAVQWGPLSDPRSPVHSFLGLDAAGSIEAGLRALATYPGPTQNFMLAQTDGRVAYTVAGAVPNDPSWGLRVLPGGASATLPALVPFAQLPHLEPARGTLTVTANNVPYAAGYPYRLAANFSPPYRAAEIRTRLRAQPAVDVALSRAIQADTTSLAERELARSCVDALRGRGADHDPDIAPAYAALAAFAGDFDPTSTGATVAQRIRVIAVRDLVSSHLSVPTANAYLHNGPGFVTLMRALRERPRGWFAHDDATGFLVDEVRRTIAAFGGRDGIATPYGSAYAIVARHPFATFGFHFWDAPSFPGSGGSYAPAVQGIVLGQSFRAIWDVGAWDAGGIDIPLGESGEPGSPHYTDAVPAWLHHDLTPLPFSAAAVTAATRATLTLRP